MRKMSNECMQGGLLIGGVEGIRPHCSAGSARPPSPAGRCGRGAGGSVSPLNQSERKSRLGAARARKNGSKQVNASVIRQIPPVFAQDESENRSASKSRYLFVTGGGRAS